MLLRLRIALARRIKRYIILYDGFFVVSHPQFPVSERDIKFIKYVISNLSHEMSRERYTHRLKTMKTGGSEHEWKNFPTLFLKWFH